MRSILGIASYKGTATLYDIFTKKVISKQLKAHSAPCADIAFNENALISCGYDAVINIFDIRKHKVATVIKGDYGWTAIALSKCGSYLVGGNMKGELISYDMRNVKKVLASTRIEDKNLKITRVDFIGKLSAGEEPSAFIDITPKGEFLLLI
jgi:protein NEDD1